MRRRDALGRLFFVAGVVGIALTTMGCADLTPGKYVKVLSSSEAQAMDSWRLWLGIAFGIELLVTVVAAVKLGASKYASWLVSNLLGIWVNWTIFGEWGYRLAAWVFGWGVVGKVLAVVGSVLGGVAGLGLLMSVPCGLVFNDLEMLKYVGLSSAISGGILAIVLVGAAANE